MHTISYISVDITCEKRLTLQYQQLRTLHTPANAGLFKDRYSVNANKIKSPFRFFLVI